MGNYHPNPEHPMIYHAVLKSDGEFEDYRGKKQERPVSSGDWCVAQWSDRIRLYPPQPAWVEFTEFETVDAAIAAMRMCANV